MAKTKDYGLSTPSAVGAPRGQADGGPPARSSQTASTPFSTADGRPQVTDGASAQGFDPLVSPRGNPQPGGDRDMVSESRPQRRATVGPMPIPDYLGDRTQTPTTAAQRLGGASGEQNLPIVGDVHAPPVTAPPWRPACGSVGNDRRPFKLRG
jgi:hypothetical protein